MLKTFAILAILAACRSDADLMPVDAPLASDTDLASFPAFRPPVPQINTAGAHVIAHPVIVPIYFTGDPDQAQLDAFLPTFIGSLHWAVLGEYGVGSATIASSVVLTDPQPPSIDVAGAGAFLSGKLDGTHPEFGPVDAASLASRVFVVNYSTAQLPSCGALHGAVAVGSGVANFALVPSCTVALGDRTAAASAGIAAVATNPVDAAGAPTGVTGFDPAHAAWGELGGEVSSACPTTDLGGVPAARMWSNVAARAYRDPCVPAPEPVYFTTAAIASDDLGARGTGVEVPLGGTVTVDLDLLSDDLTGSWQITAGEAVATQGGTAIMLPGGASGENGDTRSLSITGTAATTAGIVVIDSMLDGNTTRWLVPFDVQ